MKRLLALTICLLILLTTLSAFAEAPLCSVCGNELTESEVLACEAAAKDGSVTYICDACAQLSKEEPPTEEPPAEEPPAEETPAEEPPAEEPPVEEPPIETPEFVTVTFDPRGSTDVMEDVKVPYGTAYEFPACEFSHPYGAHFAAWGIEGTPGGGSYDPGFIVDSMIEDVTLYPHWVWNISFDGNGADAGAMEDVQVGQEDQFIVPACAFTKEGFSFIGWRLNDLDEGSVFQPDEPIYVYSDCVLIAEWKDDSKCAVRFLPGKGSGEMADLEAVPGEEFEVPACEFTAPAGAEFAYWTIEGDESAAQYCPGDKIVPEGDMTLTANYLEKAPTIYIISFDAGEGTGTMQDVEFTAYGEPDETYKVPESRFTAPSGKIFSHWTIKEDAETKYEPGDRIDVKSNITLTANYVGTVTVSFKANGGDGKMASAEIAKGTRYKVPKCKFTAPSGKVFAGWKIEGGADDLYKAGSKIRVNESLTLVAQWKDDSGVPQTGDRHSDALLILSVVFLGISALAGGFAVRAKKRG